MSPPQFRATTGRLAAGTGMPVLAIDYRKIPEHPHPAQLEDALQAFQWIARHGPFGTSTAAAILCAGDSAGGGLALALAVMLRDEPVHGAQLAGITVTSPQTDMSCSGESYTTRRWRDGGGSVGDPIFRGRDPQADSMPQIYKLLGKPGRPGSYLLTEPSISPLHAELHDLPPTLIHVGDAEVMLSDSVDFGAKARAAGSPVEVTVWPRMWHCFERFSEGCGTGVPLKEGLEALERQAAFLRRCVVDATALPPPSATSVSGPAGVAVTSALLPTQQATPEVPHLQCEIVTDGLLKVVGLPEALQDELLVESFQAGARGVCGGLCDAGGQVAGPGGRQWCIQGEEQMPWSALGLHGSHTIAWEPCQQKGACNPASGGVAARVLTAVQAAVSARLGERNALRDFAPGSIRLAFEIMGGRSIRRGQTLCGWSRDGDLACNDDGTPKVTVLLGKAQIITGFKYSKSDRESLDVVLNPGDILVRYGEGRSWVSAVVGCERVKSKGPFDFVHLHFMDHRYLRKAKPRIYARLHEPPKSPAPGDPDYRWMQYTYTVLGDRSPQGEVMMAVRGHGSEGVAPWEGA